MEKRTKLELSDTTQDVVIKLSEGNPGGLTVIVSMLKEEREDSLLLLLSMDDMNIRGSQIWIAFKDYINKLIKDKDERIGEDWDESKRVGFLMDLIMKRDKGMVDFINENRMNTGTDYMACCHGASYDYEKYRFAGNDKCE